MFIMDVPYVPAQDTPVVLAQAAVPSVTLRPDFILTWCQETESTGNPMSAMRGIDPANGLAQYLEERGHRFIDTATIASIKPTLLEGTKHGKLNRHVAENGAVYYMYDPIPDYIGKDRAVFMAEFEGKRYKIVVNLIVQMHVDEKTPLCPEPQLIKLKSKPKPTPGSSIYDPGFATISFAALEGGALGQPDCTACRSDKNVDA